MEDLLREIEKGLNANLYHLTLGMALCIPDMCAALESEDGRTSGSKYKGWYNRFMQGKMYMTAEDCYYFRCSFLHQGSTNHVKSQYDRVIFVEPDSSNNLYHNNIIEGALNIDIGVFCKELINGAQEWLKMMKDDENFLRNSKNSFKRYPNGLKPYFDKMTVYA